MAAPRSSRSSARRRAGSSRDPITSHTSTRSSPGSTATRASQPASLSGPTYDHTVTPIPWPASTASNNGRPLLLSLKLELPDRGEIVRLLEVPDGVL